jgi:16S rRNA (cytidine1402-2'-O)-methyltransferase
VPTLYVVPTPIGNLEDITLRALRVLRDVQLILAEDTRHTRKLLSHYSIGTPLRSYHQHNKLAGLGQILAALETGDVALVSDSGSPSLADPGFELIRVARAEGVDVDVLPGPSAVVTAVVAAALPAPGFLFLGFLPRHSSRRRERLSEVADLPYSLVVFEAPHRLLSTLGDVQTVLGNRVVAVARELSKVHQEVRESTVADLVRHYTGQPPRGEITLVISGADPTSHDVTDDARAELARLAVQGQDRRQAVQAVVERYGISRNEAYRLWLDTRDSGE